VLRYKANLEGYFDVGTEETLPVLFDVTNMFYLITLWLFLAAFQITYVRLDV